VGNRSALAKASSVVRRGCLAVWLVVILASVGSYMVYPQSFTAGNISAFLLRFQGEIWLVYFAMSALRGFTLLPSTPLVIAGTVLFPSQKIFVLIVSIVGISLSSSMIYFFSEYLGFNEYFENHKPELTHRIKARLEHPLGFLFVALWAFFPLVPTDLVCYLAGTTKMNYWKFIAAVMAGEMVLCSFYIFWGGSLISDYALGK
jgi:uncharacterized membrane protein YdjX (TVP38/TMEM64 family)